MKRYLIVLALLASVCGCTDVYRKTFWTYGQRREIVLYSGGKEVGRFVSTGVLHHSSEVDGVQFVDEADGAAKVVHGDYVITNLAEVKK